MCTSERGMFVFVMALASACGSHAEAPAPTVLAPPTSVAAPPSTLAPVSSIAEADVRTLLDAWASAQNAGDLAGYGALYAARFDGVRRAGPRVRRFDRAGWLEDRRGMFARPMHVEMRDVSISVSGATATAHFIQSFTEGAFHDEGPKEMTIVREESSLRIAREEMLASTLGPSPGALMPGAVMPIVSAGGQSFAVLATVPDGADWHEGAPTLLEREGVVVTRANARGSALPDTLVSLAGQAVTLDGRCSAQLGSLAVLSRVDVHFSVEQAWSGENEDGTHGTPATRSQIAREAWGEGMLLVAPIASLGACPSAAYARLASLPPALPFSRSDADAALAARVLTAFRALDAWTSLQSSYAESGGASAHWDESAGSGPSVSIWSAPNARRYAVVTADASSGGCADFSASLWSVFDVAADGSLTRVTDASSPGYFSPLAATDIDGDGRPELVVEQGVVGAVGAGLGLVEDISPVVHDCYC